jgi:hypothetical protein
MTTPGTTPGEACPCCLQAQEDTKAAVAKALAENKLSEIKLDAALTSWNEKVKRIGQLEAALRWMETYIANQPFDSLAEFLIKKKLAECLPVDCALKGETHECEG